MTALDLFAPDDADPNRPRRRCRVGKLIDDATPQSRALFVERLTSDSRETGWTDAALSKALRRAGHSVHPSQLSTHRNGLCICDEPTSTERQTAE